MIERLEELKKSTVVLDIETSAQYPDGEVIDISTNFEDYVKFARVKWVGLYSYATGEYIEANVNKTNKAIIRSFIGQHRVIVGFNSDEFDIPIMYNNDLMPENRLLAVDCMVILGSNTFYRHDGLAFKGRGALMGYKIKRNSLKAMAEAMDLETQKGDIDYKVFLKNVWSDEEEKEIKKYLRADVEVTKQMFDKLWDFWIPFHKFLPEDACMNLVWIRSSIASLTYQCACNVLNVEPTFAERTDKPPEEMGGRVIQPKYEESRNVWYVDFASLYPHIFAQFNLFNEIENFGNSFPDKTINISELEPRLEKNRKNIWHGNDLFKVRGYYDISEQHSLSKDVADKLKMRFTLKKQDPESPMIYVLKIFLNSLYGAARSEIFEQIHTENCGWDCCWLGQQIQEYTEKRMSDFGFETIAGDTDSIFVVWKGKDALCPPPKENDAFSEQKFVKACLKTIVEEIKANVPFPAETFKIDIEHDNALDYAMWPFSLEPIKLPDGTNTKNNQGRLVKERRGKKKNYVFLYHKNDELKMKISGLPIKKDNATLIGPKILEEALKPIFFERMRCKVTRKEMNEIVSEYLAKPGAVADLAREFRVQPSDSYKPGKDGGPSTTIQAQISRGYFNGQSGVIRLIKNKKIGRAGISAKYCSIEEAEEAKLSIKDLDLTKLQKELEAFVEDGK
jgi:DNA polymerase elongation subunit (family B)